MSFALLTALTAVFFAGCIVIGGVIGYFYGWKRALYYGVANLGLLTLFVIIYHTNPGLFSYIITLILDKFKFNRDYRDSALIVLRDLAIFMAYFIAFICVNFVLVGLDIAILKRLLRKKPKHAVAGKKRKLARAGLLGLLIQTICFLPISLVFSSGLSGLGTAGLIAYNKSQNKQTELVDVGTILHPKINYQNQFYYFLQNKWSQWNLLGNYGKTNQRLLSLAFLINNNFADTQHVFNTIFSETKSLFQLPNLSTFSNLLTSRQAGETSFGGLSSLSATDASKLATQAEKFASASGLTSDQFLLQLKEIYYKEKNSGEFEKITEQLKKGDVTAATKLIDEKLGNLDTSVFINNNPNLDKVIAELNKLYDVNNTQMVFQAIGLNLNDYSKADLTTLIRILTPFNIGKYIKELKEQIANFGDTGLKLAAEQITEISKKNQKSGKDALQLRKRLYLSPIAYQFFNDFLVNEFDKVFNDNTAGISTSDDRRVYKLENIKTLVSGMLNVFVDHKTSAAVTA